jgi:hypothetical protein
MRLTTLDDLVEELGEPSDARRLAPDDELLRGRVPDALLSFWRRHGFGSYKNRYFVICDPRTLDPVVAVLFKDDPELHAADLAAVGYTGDSNFLLLWHRDGRKVIVTMDQSLVTVSHPSADIDKHTGQRWSEEELIGAYLSQFRMFDTELFDEACKLHGRPGEDELFGFVPAFQLGGSPVAASMRRMKAAEHLMFLAQLGPLKLIEMEPSGESRFIRFVGQNG